MRPFSFVAQGVGGIGGFRWICFTLPAHPVPLWLATRKTPRNPLPDLGWGGGSRRQVLAEREARFSHISAPVLGSHRCIQRWIRIPAESQPPFAQRFDFGLLWRQQYKHSAPHLS